MISYKPLMKLLIDLDMTKTELAEKIGISSSTLAKFGNNQYVSLEVIDRICKALDCQPGDLFEYVPDKDD
ncbi:MAG: helix-turn-helix transcriptional regulator [Clostridiales bacterium]|nr:helix-turn-helix transcriptional regulator [Clostridiales bacterium]